MNFPPALPGTAPKRVLQPEEASLSCDKNLRSVTHRPPGVRRR